MSHRFTNLERYGAVDSTNRIARDAAESGVGEGLVVVADEQLAGRGRRDRRWFAPPGTTLLCSIVFRPQIPVDEWHLVLSAVALAARAACVQFGAPQVQLKWPNDLIATGRKLAGLLGEVVGSPETSRSGVVVGIGLNLTWPKDWPVSTGDPMIIEQVSGATTLNELSGNDISTDRFVEAMLHELEKRYACIGTIDGARQLMEEYRLTCATIGEAVRIELADETFDALVIDVTDEGRLLVDAGGELRQITVGDLVHLRTAN